MRIPYDRRSLIPDSREKRLPAWAGTMLSNLREAVRGLEAELNIGTGRNVSWQVGQLSYPNQLRRAPLGTVIVECHNEQAKPFMKTIRGWASSSDGKLWGSENLKQDRIYRVAYLPR